MTNLTNEEKTKTIATNSDTIKKISNLLTTIYCYNSTKQEQKNFDDLITKNKIVVEMKNTHGDFVLRQAPNKKIQKYFSLTSNDILMIRACKLLKVI